MLILCVMLIAFINFSTAFFDFNIFASFLSLYLNISTNIVQLLHCKWLVSRADPEVIKFLVQMESGKKMRFSTPAHRLSLDEPFYGFVSCFHCCRMDW